LGIYPGDVLEGVFSGSMEAHSLMQRANMLKLDDQCHQAVKGLACSQQHADCYCIFHTLPSLMLVFRACLSCTYNTPSHIYTTSHSFAMLKQAYLAQSGPAARCSKCSHHDSCICCNLSPLKSRMHALWESLFGRQPLQAVMQRLSSSQNGTEPLHHCLELWLFLDGNSSAA